LIDELLNDFATTTSAKCEELSFSPFGKFAQSERGYSSGGVVGVPRCDPTHVNAVLNAHGLPKQRDASASEPNGERCTASPGFGR